MKKHSTQYVVAENRALGADSFAMVLRPADGSPVPEMLPGQFVEIAVPGAGVLLNRPISIYNRTDESLEILVAAVGRATRTLQTLSAGSTMTVIGPLGNGFSTDFKAGERVLLVGGGIGIAPLYYQLRCLRAAGVEVEVVYGARTAPSDFVKSRFAELAPLHVCTDDGSEGFHGFVSAHPRVLEGEFSCVQVCGPAPMMKAMAAVCRRRAISTEVSLENMMACGLGACLCCVEKTVRGNVCVCKEGPVFNIDQLLWQ